MFFILPQANQLHRGVLLPYQHTIEKNLKFRPIIQLTDPPQFNKLHTTPYQIKYDRLYDKSFKNEKQITT